MRRQLKQIVLISLTFTFVIVTLRKESELIDSIISNNIFLSTSSSPYDVSISIDDDISNVEDPSLSFNQINPHSKSWCPNPSIKCYNSPFCKPCQRRYLFILATGRSGSTSLLKMMNALPNVRLAGENYNAVFEMYDLFNRTILNDIGKEEESNHENEEESNGTSHNFYDVKAIEDGIFMHNGVKEGPFAHNAIPMGSLACTIQHFANTLNPPEVILEEKYKGNTNAYIKNDNEHPDKTILGMKEIRMQDQDLISWTPNEAYTFLQQNFPCARYIINYNSRFIYQSKTMKEHLRQKVGDLKRKEVQTKLKLENKFLIDLNTLLGNETSWLIELDEWKNDVNVLNDIVDWLGFEGCKFNTVLYENHGGFGHDETELVLGDQCRYPHL